MANQHMLLMLNDGISNQSPALIKEVKILQQLLKDWGVLAANEPIDGLFGGNTEKAVKLFQSKRPLVIDGIVGQKTWAALLKTDPSDVEIIPRPSEGEIDKTTFPSGQFNDEVKEINNRGYVSLIKSTATKFGIQPAIIAGIGSRESNWGLALNPEGPTGTGDFGHGRGLMQIDDGAFPDFTSTDRWKDPQENIHKSCEILADNFSFFSSKFGSGNSLVLQAAIAAYNAGAGTVLGDIQDGLGPDHTTTGHDYSRDVLNRAGWYRQFAGF